MKKVWLLFLPVFGLISCNQQTESTATESIGVIIENEDSFERRDEQLVITRAQLKKLEQQWEEGLIPLVSDEEGALPAQVDDLDGDGSWDELAFVMNIAGKSTKELIINPVKEGDVPSFPQRAHAFLGKSLERNGKFEPVKEEILPEDHEPQAQPPLYQMEGPVWENDKGAFRLYFDIRNGKDIFGKSVSEIMMDSVGLPGGDYHTQAPWGMDVLKAGASLGAGAVAFLIENEAGEEKLYRLGPQVEQMKYDLVADGPVRAIIRMSYSGAQAGDRTFDVEDLITIWAGSPGYESKVSITNTEEPIQLVTGIVNLHATDPPVAKTTDNYALLATHDQQSENKDYLGMALLTSKENFVRFDETPNENAEITHTYTVVLDITPDSPVTYEFLTGWEGRDKIYADSTEFIAMVETYAKQQFQPVNISIK